MKIEKLFHVLVVSGAAATTGLLGCGDEEGQEGNSGGASSGGSGSSAGSGGSGGGADACDAKCGPSAVTDAWTDCNGCCCWLPIGSTASSGSEICGVEPCCE